MRIFQEEIFGPVLSVATASSLEEALKFANSVEYGLTTSIFTSNITSVMKFIEDVETGMVHVNEPTVGGEAQLPFGGTKSTGVGEREMAEEGLNFFTEIKTVFINYSGSRALDDALGLGLGSRALKDLCRQRLQLRDFFVTSKRYRVTNVK